MNRLLQLALTQRLLVLLAVAVLIGAGIQAFSGLAIDAFPDVSPTQVKIVIKAPGMTPEEVETQITAPVEVELLGIPRQIMLRSIAKYALTDITLDFEKGTDIYWARQQVAERLQGIWESLPEVVSGGIAPMTTPLGEMFMFTVDGAGHSLAERRTLLDWVIRPALRTVPGVADVNSLGGYVETFEVVPDNVAMAARGITLSELEEAIISNNNNDGSGRLVSGEETLLVRATARIRDLQDLADIVIDSPEFVPVRVADVATVRLGSLARYGAVTLNGEVETVQGLVLSLRGSNAREVVAGIEKKLDDIRPALPQGISLNVFYNRGNLVSRAIGTVSAAMAEATLLVLILLVLFLGSFRAALAVALTLPLAALATFLLMSVTGMSANLMSLGGLAIAIGMLVDAAVVVVENITATLNQPQLRSRLPYLHLIYRATREVAVPVTSGIAIIVIVFLPLLTLEGLEGDLFTPVALTIVFALAAALLISLTAVPVFSSFLLTHASHDDPWLPRKLAQWYRPALLWSLDHTRVVIAGAAALLVITGLLYLQLGKTFIPTLDEGDIIVQLEKIPSISLQQSVVIDQQVEAALLAQIPDIERIVARAGSDEIGMDPMGLNETDMFMVLKPRDAWSAGSKAELIEQIRAVIEQFPGIGYGFTQPIEMRVSEMLTGVRGDVAVKVFGSELDTLNRLAREIVATLETVPGAEDVFSSQNQGAQYLSIEVDRSAAGRLGLTARDLQQYLRAQLEGSQLGIVQQGNRRVPLTIRGAQDLRHSPSRYARLPVMLPDGQVVPLQSVATIKRTPGVVSIARERGQRFSVVRSNVSGRDLVGFVEDAQVAVADQVDLPPGYYLEWGGQFENQQRAAARLAVVVPISLGMVFLLLFSTFGSVRQAILVISNVPFALVGGVIALTVTGEYLSVPASVGFIALLGIAVLNGVVMVSHFNTLHSLGLPLESVIDDGAMRRVRPDMMTATIAAFGLAPLLFATGPGSEIQRPLAIVVVGGLISATMLTLILLPILYRRFGLSTRNTT